MNKVDISEIRRGLNPEKTSADRICGCYVDEKGQIISIFAQSPQTLSQQDAEKYMALFRRVLSGGLGKNLVEIPFEPEQVANGEEHKLLTALKDTGLKVDAAVEKFFRNIVEALSFEGNYLILLLHNVHDVAWRPKDEFKSDDAPSEEQFSHILCAICPVKQTGPALSYCAHDQAFHDREPSWVVASPELGFLFPAFEDGGANIYSALCYGKDASSDHADFVNAVFGSPAPMPAIAQRETFDALLSDALEEECGLDVVQTVHEQLTERIDAVKADKHAEPATVTKNEVSAMLRDCGVSEERRAAFEERFDEEFGPTDLRAENIMDVKRFELRTPDVMIKVAPDRTDLIQTRIIDGSRYILIRADEGVEVNGINIAIGEADSEATEM